GSIFIHRLEISKENPALKPARKAAMVIYRDADDDTGQPYPKRTIAPKSFDAAISAHQRFLDDVLRISGIARGSHCDLQQKRSVLLSSRVEIDIFRSNRYR